MAETSPRQKSGGCGFLCAFFGRNGFLNKRSTSGSSLPGLNSSSKVLRTTSASSNSKRRRGVVGSSNHGAYHEIPTNSSDPHGATSRSPDKIISKPSPNQSRTPQPSAYKLAMQQPSAPFENYNGGLNRKVPREAIGISGELDSMINNDYQRTKASGGLVRASSGNVMLYGNLGNLRQAPQPQQSAGTGPLPSVSVTMENVAKKIQSPNAGKPASLCRALSTRMDPETLKIMGNEDYKNGRFAEALALFDAAISINPNVASYRSNKSAALTALGMLLEAVFECREAIQIEPHYHRAHHRLANLYIRLGDAEKAIYHYKHAGPEADPDDKTKALALQGHLGRCTDAKRVRDWNLLVEESGRAISAGADSAPQIFALQAETLMKLQRHEDADMVLTNGPRFDVDACTTFFGTIGNANLLMVRAQVDMAAGMVVKSFDDALAAAQRAAILDPNSKEVNMVAARAQAVAQARSNGNKLFKASRFLEASDAYVQGLDHDPYNSVLLCNRAACHSRLGQFHEAVKDCTEALNVRPSYSKARLRRADCNGKLGNWEASIEDYQILVYATPEDEEVRSAWYDAQTQFKKTKSLS